jgi:hypothetical protein
MADKQTQGPVKNFGALREKMSAKDGEALPKEKLAAKISKLQGEAAGDKELTEAKRTMLKQLVLARTLGGMKKEK